MTAQFGKLQLVVAELDHMREGATPLVHSRALRPDETRELIEQAHAGIPKTNLAPANGISRETVYR